MGAGMVERVIHGGKRQTHAGRANEDAAKLILVLQHSVEPALGLDTLLGLEFYMIELQRGRRRHLLTDRLEREGGHAWRIDGNQPQ